MRLHLNKRAIRALGVAESFEAGDKKSTLAGVVMRTDLVTDGFVLGRATVEGDDATKAIARMYRKLGRNDVNVLMLSGCIISLYNIIDVDALAERLKVPVVCVTYKESSGIERSIMHRFGNKAPPKLEAYKKLGKRKRLELKTGYAVYYRASSITDLEVERLLNMFTLQGGIPEPVRVAKLLARALS
jgi:endonuclease V-like protein UPF0215 family